MRYSYKVQLREAQAELLALLIASFKKPDDEGLRKRIQTKESEIQWFGLRIEEGLDPGPRNL